MSEEAEGGEKSHEPTQRRLDEARKRGEVAQSADLTTAAAYGGLALAALGLGGWSCLTLGASLSTLLGDAAALSEEAFGGGAQPLWGAVLGQAALAVAPWFALPAAGAVLALVAQRALVVAPERLSPKFSRVNPLAVFKQKFGLDGLMEFARGLLKLGAHGTVLGLYLWDAMPAMIETAGQAPGIAALALADLTAGLLLRVFVVALALGAIDLVWQRLSFLRRHRMSRKEVMDEMKDSEGDPHVKGQRRSRAVAIAMNQMLAEVPKADVVIVNPTHYAVALKWDRKAGRAPVCVAKGVDEMARAIRERAAEHGVPVRSDPPTARALHATVEIGAEVARAEWRAVAAAIRFADAIRARARRKGGR
jgi:flagellar biosynthetic protein FlhB